MGTATPAWVWGLDQDLPASTGVCPHACMCATCAQCEHGGAQAFDKGLMEYGMMTAVKAPLSASPGSASEGQQAGQEIKVLVAA
jgi:hypothetical protein